MGSPVRMIGPAAAESPRRRATTPVAQRFLRGLGAAWIVVCALGTAAVLAVALAWARADLVPIAVQTGSMEPALPVHALIFVEQVPPGDVRPGDIITFDPPGSAARVTHRVVERSRHAGRWYFRTKGDANPAADDWRRGRASATAADRGVTYGTHPAVRYRFHVPEAGRLVELGAHPRLRTALLLLPFACVGLQLLVRIWRPREAGA